MAMSLSRSRHLFAGLKFRQQCILLKLRKPIKRTCTARGGDTVREHSPASIMSSTKVTKTIVTSPEIYKPVGPYSQAILADKTLYVSGVLGLTPDGQMVSGGAEEQARQVLGNMKHVLEAGGASLSSVVKTTILLADIADFQAVNKIYAEYFPKDSPARATFQVGKLPMGAAVEIDCIALTGDVNADGEMSRTVITSPEIYQPLGPYSQAILANETLYVSGVLGLNPDGEMVKGGAYEQARQVLENIKQVLRAGNASLASVIKTTILLGNINDFQVVNKVYTEYFPKDSPARATFQVGKLPMRAAVEIDCIALSGYLEVCQAVPCPCDH